MRLSSLAKKWVPPSLHLPLRYAYLRATRKLDIELAVLRKECIGCVTAIDVGANIGIYTYGLAKFCRKVESFEPLMPCTRMLRAYGESRGNITVHNVGLSNRAGTTELYVPFLDDKGILNAGLASVNDPGGHREIVPISIRRLDDYAFADVGIIKVDVEGHELEMLEGAVETIITNKPLLLVEIEQRHLKGRSIEDVFCFIRSLGYIGRYYCKGKCHPLEDFSYEIHQLPYLHDVYSEAYVNNFLFKAA